MNLRQCLCHSASIFGTCNYVTNWPTIEPVFKGFFCDNKQPNFVNLQWHNLFEGKTPKLIIVANQRPSFLNWDRLIVSNYFVITTKPASVYKSQELELYSFIALFLVCNRIYLVPLQLIYWSCLSFPGCLLFCPVLPISSHCYHKIGQFQIKPYWRMLGPGPGLLNTELFVSFSVRNKQFRLFLIFFSNFNLKPKIKFATFSWQAIHQVWQVISELEKKSLKCLNDWERVDDFKDAFYTTLCLGKTVDTFCIFNCQIV